MIFWSLGLLLFAMLFILQPFLLRAKSQTDLSFERNKAAERQNIDLFEEQKLLFENQLNSGELDQSEYDQLYVGAQKLLLANTDAAPISPNESFAGGFWLLPCLIIVLPIITVATYSHLGAEKDQVIAELLEQQSALYSDNQLYQLSDNDRLIKALKKRVKKRPNNIYYWTILAQSAISQNDMVSANNYFLAALEVDPQDSFLLAQYAESLFLVDDSKFTSRVVFAVDRAFTADPTNHTVLGLKGIEAFGLGDTNLAITFWKRAQLNLDIKSPVYKGLQVGIDQARLLMRSVEGVAKNDAPYQNSSQIEVNISLGKSVPFFKDKFVFVAAIQANGSAMPLAAKKIKVSQLPITLTLSDMDALIPGHELSTSKEIKLVARLSLSGSATPLPGDWEVVSEPFKLKTENLKQVLIISQKRP